MPKRTVAREAERLPKTPMEPGVAVYFPPGAPWAQIDGEPTDLYTQFLFYLTLGPTRSLSKCAKLWLEKYGRKKSKRSDARYPEISNTDISSNWEYNASMWRWRERAARFDVYTISQIVPEIAGTIFECVKLYAEKVHEALSDPTVKPTDWHEASQALQNLTGFISPQSIAAAALHNGGDTRNGEASSVDTEQSDGGAEEG